LEATLILEVVERALAEVLAEVRSVGAAAAVADDEDGLLVDVGRLDELDHRLHLLAVDLREQLDEVAEVMIEPGPVRGGQHEASYRGPTIKNSAPELNGRSRQRWRNFTQTAPGTFASWPAGWGMPVFSSILKTTMLPLLWFAAIRNLPVGSTQK